VLSAPTTTDSRSSTAARVVREILASVTIVAAVAVVAVVMSESRLSLVASFAVGVRAGWFGISGERSLAGLLAVLFVLVTFVANLFVAPTLPGLLLAVALIVGAWAIGRVTAVMGRRVWGTRRRPRPME